MKTETTTKKSIPVSNLTLSLWLGYVKQAAIDAGIVEEVKMTDPVWGEHIELHTSEAVADDVAHCMYCSCMGQEYSGKTSEEIIRGEAEGMLYQLEVTAKYDLHNTADSINALRAALVEILAENDEAEQKAKTDAKATDLIEKVRRHFDLFESCRSAWDKGVRVYADELLDELLEAIRGGWVDLDDMGSDKLVRKALLNGASDWKEYSWGGCSLIYDGDIAERLCTPSELKKTRHGERRPNGREEWLDVQARALRQACGRIGRGMKYAIRQQLKEEVA